MSYMCVISSMLIYAVHYNIINIFAYGCAFMLLLHPMYSMTAHPIEALSSELAEVPLERRMCSPGETTKSLVYGHLWPT